MNVTIYYGMSGSLKGTTVDSVKSNYDIVIGSYNKPYIQASLDLTGKRPDDLDLALFRLVQLKNLSNDESVSNLDVVIERGITDFLESWTSDPQNSLESSELQKYIGLEERYLGKIVGPEGKIRRVLLNMQDSGFIRDVILTEPTRLARFPNLQVYLDRQVRYLEFTKKFNNIESEIIIYDANSYIENLKK